MRKGEKVVCVRNTFKMGGHEYEIPDLDLFKPYEIIDVQEGKCGCGGDRISLEGVNNHHCTKGFIRGSDVAIMYNNVKDYLTPIDFEVLEEDLGKH